MAVTAALKALALVLFVAALAGATYGVMQVTGDTVTAQIVTASAARNEANVTGGHDVTFLVNILNRDDAGRDVTIQVDGVATGTSDATTVLGKSTVGVFVTVRVAEGAPVGEHPLKTTILVDGKAGREREDLLRVRVLAPAPGFAPGDGAEIVYTGRLTATGRVFNTNDPALATAAFPKTDSYRFSQGLLPIQAGARPSVVQGFYEALAGMQPGETRTTSFGPEKGYGPATEEQTEPRQESIERALTLENGVQSVPRQTFDQYVVEDGQGNASDFAVGSIFTLNENNNEWPYRIVTHTDDVVEYTLAAEVGQAYTVYPFWPNASVISSIDDDQVAFFTTPTTQPTTNCPRAGDANCFTMRQYWPAMSALLSMNETHILVQHSPTVGYSYTLQSQLGQTRQASVKSVNETAIVISLPSPSPLAGRDLTFDITLATLEKRSS